VLRPFVAEVVIGNALRVRAIAEAKIKTDKVDSRVLAELLRCESEFRRTISLRATAKSGSEIFTVAGTSDGTTTQRRSGQRHTAFATLRTGKNASAFFAAASAGAK